MVITIFFHLFLQQWMGAQMFTNFWTTSGLYLLVCYAFGHNCRSLNTDTRKIKCLHFMIQECWPVSSEISNSVELRIYCDNVALLLVLVGELLKCFEKSFIICSICKSSLVLQFAQRWCDVITVSLFVHRGCLPLKIETGARNWQILHAA